jgi:hypothetical protein
MMKLRSVTAGLMATAMLATSAAPAMAQGYPGGYGYGRPSYGGQYDRYRHRRHRDDTGAIVAGVIGVGILAAILASASKSSSRTNGGYDNRAENRAGNIRTEDAAADACAVAAEQQFGQNARTRSIDAVDRVSDGFNVRGMVEVSAQRSNSNGDQRSFSCSVRYGEVQRVDFGGYAYNGY